LMVGEVSDAELIALKSKHRVTGRWRGLENNSNVPHVGAIVPPRFTAPPQRQSA
jgi:hypothetical protein